MLCQRRPQRSSWGSRAKSLRDAGTSPWWGCKQPRSRHKTGHSPRHSSWQSSRMPSHSTSCSSSQRPCPSNWDQWNRRSTPFHHHQDSLEVVPAPSTTGSLETQSNCPREGTLLTECTLDGQVAFYTHLHLTTKTGMKHLTVKMDPGTQVNMIPLSRYRKTFTQKMAENGYPIPSSLNPTSDSWISHDGKPKPFLGQFIADIRHVSQDRSYPICFCIFEDAMSPHILLLYATSEWLGILQFNVSNKVAQVHIDAISLPNPAGLRKPTKMKAVSFKDPLTMQNSPATLQSLSLSIGQWQEEDHEDSHLQEPNQGLPLPPTPLPSTPHSSLNQP